MSLKDVLDNITMNGYSAAERQEIEDIITEVYNKSPTGREMLEKIATEGLTINNVPGTANGGDNVVNLDLSFAGQNSAIDANGNAFTLTNTNVLVHELVHAIEDKVDIVDADADAGRYTSRGTWDYQGETETMTNTILTEMGVTQQQISYYGVGTTQELPPGTNYTHGNKIDVAIAYVDRIDTSGNPNPTNDLLIDTGNPNTNGWRDSTLISGGGNDFLYGREGNDVLNPGADNDYAYGGTGNDRVIGGTGWDIIQGGNGIDTLEFTTFANTETPEEAASKTGLRINIDGHSVWVGKDTANGNMRMPETDDVITVEAIKGSARGETFIVKNIEKDMYLDGGPGANRLVLKGEAANYTIDPTDGVYPPGHTFEGQTYDGRITNGTHTIYYKNIPDDRIGTFIASPSVKTGQTPETTPVPDGGKAETIGLTDAIRMLSEDQQSLNSLDAAKLTPAQAATRDLVNHPGAIEMFQNLRKAGVNEISVDINEQMSPDQRAKALLEAGAEATRAAGLEVPSTSNENIPATPERSNTPDESENDMVYGL